MIEWCLYNVENVDGGSSNNNNSWSFICSAYVPNKVKDKAPFTERVDSAYAPQLRLRYLRDFVVADAEPVPSSANDLAVDYGVHRLWEHNNVGKRYEDILVWDRDQPNEVVYSTLDLSWFSYP
ncbi:cytochrome b-c1 complex subunit 9 [Olea europaea subsp. europaea]|uniref:Cytochrome b-c1 complex subunit 9 n=1 Tax=Olea europaea subsp. europaea TaxID=158383 RepID=A0A8S0V755_OLEEU|nr:cytochrome b-c1 complex subunit 9 [Olea europaea subsp. europaea]